MKEIEDLRNRNGTSQWRDTDGDGFLITDRKFRNHLIGLFLHSDDAGGGLQIDFPDRGRIVTFFMLEK